MSEIADGGAATDVVPVALLATEQRGDGERGAAVGSVLRGNETAKGPVCRQYFVGDRLCDGFAQALLLLRGDAGRKFFGGQQERVRRDDALALRETVYENDKEPRPKKPSLVKGCRRQAPEPAFSRLTL